MSHTDEQAQYVQRVRRELTGTLVTMRDKRLEPPSGPRTPWWWTDDDDASESSMMAMSEMPR